MDSTTLPARGGHAVALLFTGGHARDRGCLGDLRHQETHLVPYALRVQAAVRLVKCGQTGIFSLTPTPSLELKSSTRWVLDNSIFGLEHFPELICKCCKYLEWKDSHLHAPREDRDGARIDGVQQPVGGERVTSANS